MRELQTGRARQRALLATAKFKRCREARSLSGALGRSPRQPAAFFSVEKNWGSFRPMIVLKTLNPGRGSFLRRIALFASSGSVGRQLLSPGYNTLSSQLLD